MAQKRLQGVRSRFRRIALNPWFAGLAAIVGALAGLLGAMWAEQIRTVFPFNSGHVISHTVLFWVAVTVFGLMFGSNFWAQSKATEEQLSKLGATASSLAGGLESLRESSGALEEQVKTLPSRDFLRGYGRRLTQCYPIAIKGTEQDATIADTREGILAVLSSLAYMAQLFDGALRTSEYSANLMIFRTFHGLSSELVNEYQSIARFTEVPGAGGSAWSGVLELIPDLAVFLQGDNIQVNPTRLPRFTFGIPLPTLRNVNGKSAVLPGAPDAFCNEAYAFVKDTYEFADECRRDRALRESVSTDMDRYFKEGAGRDIRSFVSIVLPRTGCIPAGSRNLEPLGVVNIHSDAAQMIRGKGIDHFVPLTTPHRLLISRLLENLLRKEAEAHI